MHYVLSQKILNILDPVHLAFNESTYRCVCYRTISITGNEAQVFLSVCLRNVANVPHMLLWNEKRQ